MKKSFFRSAILACLSAVALIACTTPFAHAASPAYVSDEIVVTWSSQGVTGWAAVLTDLGSAGSTVINDTTPTIIGYATAFAPDYNSTTKVYSVYMFLTQAGAAAYLAANPHFSGAVGWYKPSTHN